MMLHKVCNAANDQSIGGRIFVFPNFGSLIYRRNYSARAEASSSVYVYIKLFIILGGRDFNTSRDKLSALA
jgi:hypothetical protein